MKYGISILAAGAVLAAGAQAQVSKQGSGYLLRYKFTKGQTLKLNVGVGLKFGATANPPTKLGVNMKVVDVQKGIATIKITGKGPDGKPMDRTVKIDNRGRVQGQKETSVESAAFIELPEKPVPIGGTFKSGSKGNVPGMGAMNNSSVFKLVSVGMSGGKNLAVLSVSGNATGVLPMKIAGTVKLTALDGMIWSYNSTASGTVANPGSSTSKPTNFTATVTISRG